MSKRSELEICSRCVMANDAPGFTLLAPFGCNFCEIAMEVWQTKRGRHSSAATQMLREHLRQDEKSDFDCIVGLSGGVDSSWTLVQAVELGLKPLVVHMDNTWNSDLANNNISNLISKLNVELVTKVVDASAFNRAFKALMSANFLDLEILYDNLLHSVVYGVARERRIPTILSGFNLSTELMQMPEGWQAQNKFDAKLIRSAADLDGGPNLNLPLYSSWAWMADSWIRRIRWERFLDVLPDYNLASVTSVLTERFGFQPYPVKHYENTLTMFYQGYILPRKYGVDKRRVHLSSLVLTGQLERNQALEKLNQDPLGSDQDVKEIVSYVCDRLEMSPANLKAYIDDKSPPNPRLASEIPIMISRFVRAIRESRRRVKP